MISALGKFIRDKAGNAALLAAVVAPPLLGGTAVAVDFAYFRHHASKLQSAADAAAVSATREMAIAGTTNAELREITKANAEAAFFSDTDPAVDTSALSIKTKINRRKLELNVELSYNWSPFFAHYLDDGMLPIVSTAVASLSNQHSICTLALKDSGPRVFRMSKEAVVDASDCSIHSNSSHKRGLDVRKNSKLISNSTCTAGGFRGPTENFSPLPVTDCPTLQDPLSGRDFPSYTNCDHNNLVIKKQTRRLYPGVYCGGIRIRNKATVYFEPGTYIIAGGDLNAGGSSNLSGDGVSLYFTDGARMAIKNSVKLSFTAPKTGPMTGILVAASPTNDPKKTFEVQSADARKFTGLIYTPNNTFKIGGDPDGDGQCEEVIDTNEMPVGKDDPAECTTQMGSYSEWTAIIANKIFITTGVELVLNADYEQSSVPVPPNAGTLGSQAKLLR